MEINSFVGEVVEGFDLVKLIESIGTPDGKLQARVTIARSGVLQG